MSYYPSAEEETGLGGRELARKRRKSHLCTRFPRDTLIFNDKIKIHRRSFDSNTQNRFMQKKEHKLVNSFIRRVTSCWCQRRLLLWSNSLSHTHTGLTGKKNQVSLRLCAPSLASQASPARMRGVNCRLRDQTEGVKVQSSKILAGQGRNIRTRFWRVYKPPQVKCSECCHVLSSHERIPICVFLVWHFQVSPDFYIFIYIYIYMFLFL